MLLQHQRLAEKYDNHRMPWGPRHTSKQCSVKLIWKFEKKRSFYCQNRRSCKLQTPYSDVNAWNCHLNAEMNVVLYWFNYYSTFTKGLTEVLLSALVQHSQGSLVSSILVQLSQAIHSGIMVCKRILTGSQKDRFSGERCNSWWTLTTHFTPSLWIC